MSEKVKQVKRNKLILLEAYKTVISKKYDLAHKSKESAHFTSPLKKWFLNASPLVVNFQKIRCWQKAAVCRTPTAVCCFRDLPAISAKTTTANHWLHQLEHNEAYPMWNRGKKRSLIHVSHNFFSVWQRTVFEILTTCTVTIYTAFKTLKHHNLFVCLQHTNSDYSKSSYTRLQCTKFDYSKVSHVYSTHIKQAAFWHKEPTDVLVANM